MVVQPRLREHHGLAAERAHLRAADVEAIRQRRQIPERHVTFRAGQPAPQPRAVHKEDQPVRVADPAQRLQLVQLRPQAAGKIHHSLSCVAVLFAHPDGRALALGGLGILSDSH